MAPFATAIVLVSVILSVCEGAPTEFRNAVHQQPGINALFLGTVDGKSYLADDTYRSWEDAKVYCTSVGMRLATIRNDVQRDFIDGIDSPQFQNSHWTAGRDARSKQQFSWDHDNQMLYGNLRFHSYEEKATCVGYDSRVGMKSYFSRPCHHLKAVLCESI